MTGRADDDLERIISLALDLATYRAVEDSTGLDLVTWRKLSKAVAGLPEARRADAAGASARPAPSRFTRAQRKNA